MAKDTTTETPVEEGTATGPQENPVAKGYDHGTGSFTA
jgi:hypothetical protein